MSAFPLTAWSPALSSPTHHHHVHQASRFILVLLRKILQRGSYPHLRQLVAALNFNLFYGTFE
jgi:hypothetical protein